MRRVTHADALRTAADDGTSTARSTSASVVVRPSVSRSAPRAHSLVDAHRRQHVRRLHRAAGARRRRAGAHAGFVEQVQQRLVLDAARCTRAPSRRPCRAAATVSRTSGSSRAQPSTSGRAARRCARSPSSRSASVRRSASAIATMPATFCVPLRRSRSCPPPISSGSNADAVASDQHADALRPAELVRGQRQQVDVRRDGRAGRASTPPAPRRCARTALGCARGGPRRRPRRRSVIVPTSLLTAMTDTTDDVGVERVGQLRRDRSRPAASTPTTRPPACSTACSTAWCSAAEHSALPPRRPTTPRIAVLSASVPPPVNIDLARLAADDVGDHVAGLVERLRAPRGRSGASRSGWRTARSRNGSIASTASAPHRRGGGMIEVGQLVGHRQPR